MQSQLGLPAAGAKRNVESMWKAGRRGLVACLIVLVTPAARADEEQDLIATLESAAGVPQKCAACQKLRIVGTVRAVPALAALLGEERTSHAARYALEGIPCAEAGAALREAASRYSGPVKAGLIDSLGWRRDRQAVPFLTPLLADVDLTIASAAASALGRIGGRDAVAALSAARDKAPPALQAVVLEGLLRCAEQLQTAGDAPGAAALYRDLLAGQAPAQFRAAAWRGLVLADAGQRSELVTRALGGSDVLIRTVALQLVRELGDPQVIAACRAQWASLPAESQLAVMDADLKRGAESLPTVLAATQSAHVSVRVPAWRALAELNVPATVATLAQAAAQGETAERDAARDTLARIHGPGVQEALFDEIGKSDAAVKAELLRVLGERNEAGAVSVLLENASAGAEPVRLAALESLRKLAAEEALAPLLALAGKQRLAADREPLLKALYATCQASRNKDQAARMVIDAINGAAAEQRRQFVAVLAALGTPEALNVAQKAAQDEDVELAKEAVRVLAQWPNATPAPQLLEMARSSKDSTLHALAMRGFVQLAGQVADPAERVALLSQALTVARRVEEKRQALGQLGQVPARPALEAVLPHLTDAGLANEAGAAAVSIAEKLIDSQPQAAAEAAAKIMAHCQSADVVRRAAALRGKPQSGSFLRDWLVCGPYRQAGVTGAEKMFPIEFGPEKQDEEVSWRQLPSTDMVNLGLVFPAQTDCVAYLKTQIIAPDNCDALLLLGSDDGVKAWLNGTVVHANNIDRGAVPDQDIVPIQLKKGANLLMLKITQGGGGWQACARIAGRDGAPIAGLATDVTAGQTPAK